MATVVDAALTRIFPNPFRGLDTYPIVERKVEALMRSMQDVGAWEGVIARKRKGDEYEIAFGHHRFTAAVRLKLASIPLVVRDLTDKQMLQFMGRENMEDYNADFLVMLNAWEAAIKFMDRNMSTRLKGVDIANVLGWTSTRGTRSDPNMSATAQACYAAHALLVGGHVDREDLQGLTVDQARIILQRSHSKMEQLEKVASQKKLPRAELQREQKTIARAAKATIAEARTPQGVAPGNLRARVDTNWFEISGRSKKASVMFSEFAADLADTIERTFKRDATAEKLEEVCKSIDKLTTDDDRAGIEKIAFALGQHVKTTEGWQKRLIPSKQKIVAIEQLQHRKE